MANNRLILRCGICREEIAIAALRVGEWVPARAEAASGFAAYLEKHQAHDGTLHVWLDGENTEQLDVLDDYAAVD